MGRSIEKLVPPEIADFIWRNRIYQGPLVKDYITLTHFCADELFKKKAVRLNGYDLSDETQPTEYTLVASGTSTRHARALADHIIMEVKKSFGVNPLGVEGTQEGRWIVIDYGSLMIHIFYDFVRDEYKLEELWQKAQDLVLEDKTAAK